MGTTPEDIAAFNTTLDGLPGDWDTMLVLADALEEQGEDELASAYRWCVENGKRPYQAVSHEGKWWTVPSPEESGVGDLIRTMTGNEDGVTKHSSRHSAMVALADALAVGDV